VQAARFSTIVFCDDDNWLGEDYLDTAYPLMAKDLKIGVLGGAITPAGERPIPAWFLTRCGCFAVGAQADHSGDISARGYVWGAGAVVRRNLLLRIYEQCGEGLLVGRAGNQQGCGDDSEICKWFLLAGHTLHYCEDLELIHFMPAERIRKEVFQRLLRDGAASMPYLVVYDALLVLLEPGVFRSVSIVRRLLALVRGVGAVCRMQAKDIRQLLSLVRCCRRAKAEAVA
jgi:hypothetical protein